MYLNGPTTKLVLYLEFSSLTCDLNWIGQLGTTGRLQFEKKYWTIAISFYVHAFYLPFNHDIENKSRIQTSTCSSNYITITPVTRWNKNIPNFHHEK